jgi:predicted hotdog family 3-hydroxylacyl-ACP dehydratase
MHNLIPQQPPFVMIDELLRSDETLTRTGFRVAEENVLVCNGQFTEAGLLENIAQTAAACAGFKAGIENKPVQVGYIGAVTNFEVFALPGIGEKIITEVQVDEIVFDVSIISGKVWRNEELIAQCQMKVFLMPGK